MLNPKSFFDQLQQHNIHFYTGVPDSLLKHICAYITDHSQQGHHIIAANEGAAIGLAIGHHLATGAVPLVYLQNSGLGNIVNPLLSLADKEVYGIPIILLIGWRGEPNIKDEPQHVKQGRVTRSLLDAMEIPYHIVPENDDDASQIIQMATEQALSNSAPVALLVRKNTFDSYRLQSTIDNDYRLTREDAIGNILDQLNDNDVVIGTTGMASREIFECRAKNKKGHHRDFLTVGGMGHASQIALALANATPLKRIFCIDGDGAALMHLGALTTNAAFGGENFHHIILNNAAHDSVGGQATLGFTVDLKAIAQGAGYKTVLQAVTTEEITEALNIMTSADHPSLLEIRVCRGNRADLGRPTTTPANNKQALMTWLHSDDD